MSAPASPATDNYTRDPIESDDIEVKDDKIVVTFNIKVNTVAGTVECDPFPIEIAKRGPRGQDGFQCSGTSQETGERCRQSIAKLRASVCPPADDDSYPTFAGNQVYLCRPHTIAKLLTRKAKREIDRRNRQHELTETEARVNAGAVDHIVKLCELVIKLKADGNTPAVLSFGKRFSLVTGNRNQPSTWEPTTAAVQEDLSARMATIHIHEDNEEKSGDAQPYAADESKN